MFLNSEKRIQFYKHTKNGYLLRILTLDDMFYWGADRLINVIFALYVVEEIVGGSVKDIGFILMLFYIISAVSSIPIGRFFDKQKGYIDEVIALSISGFITGIAYFLLAFSTQMWQVYLLMSFVGLAQSININAWRTIFYNSIPQKENSETLGVYQTLMSILRALIVGMSGLLAENFGFRLILIIGSIMLILAGFIPLLIKNIVNRKEKRS